MTTRSYLLSNCAGQMHGTLHREVREAHEMKLRPGTVLVLRQVGVLTTRRNLRNQYLNVTSNNLVSIYFAPDQLRPDCVEVVRVRDISLLEVARSIRDIQERRLVIDLPATHLQSHRDERLFTSVGGPRRLCVQLQEASRTPSDSSISGNSKLVADNSSPSNWGFASAQGREPSLSVSKFTSAQRSICPQLHQADSQIVVPNGSAGDTRTTLTVASNQSFQYCKSNSAPSSCTSQVQPNSLPVKTQPLLNNAQATGFKPKTSQLKSLTGPHIMNGWSCARLDAQACDTQGSLKPQDLDDEQRIVENVFDSIDTSQLFDEDF